ncbi:MAG: aminoacyl-tRNA hydrolase [Deltaproteobacteria bacterium]|nr:aminoacyl-tRNA hydrolase [Deltaproteobacteria bacterium]
MGWLIVGLGNPGSQYAKNRHNIGAMIVEALAARAGASWQTKFRARWARVSVRGKDVTLLVPQTYMNLSGTSVGEAASFFKVPPAEVLVVHDELDLPFRDVRVKIGGGHAGHNGLRSIFEHFGKDFVRVRCGIGRPQHGDVSHWVLSDFKGDEAIELPLLIDKGVEAVELVLDNGALAAQNAANARPAAKKAAPPKAPGPAPAAADKAPSAAVKAPDPKSGG